MSTSSFSLSTEAVPSRWMVEVVVELSLTGAFGVALPVIGSAAAGRGPTNESFGAHPPDAGAFEDEPEAQPLEAGAEEVTGYCEDWGREESRRMGVHRYRRTQV
ncbi:MAG TPA: hypothetical protein VIG99_28540 [Myxococcaceae bacterium]